MVLDILNGLGVHLSTWMFLNGIITLVPSILDRSSSPRIKQANGEIKTTLNMLICLIQLGFGTMSFWGGGVYVRDILFAARPVNTPALITLFGGGFASFTSATREWPWAVLWGTGIGTAGSYAIYTLVSPVTNLAAPAAILIFVLLFYATWVITKPPEDLLKAIGKATSFTTVATLIGTLEAVMGVLTAIGLWVL